MNKNVLGKTAKDKDFPFYQDSYQQIMSKEPAEAIKDDVQDMAKRDISNLSGNARETMSGNLS